MILAVLLLQAAPTVAAVDRLPPAEAGTVVLRGKTHGPVEAVEVVPLGHMAPPGFVERDLVERPVPTDGGCVRRRWRASFRSPTLERDGPFVLDSVYAMTEVALTATATCPTSDYVHLNPGIEPGKGLATLLRADGIRTGRIRVAFGCKDHIGDAGFCRNRASILRELRTRRPWIMTWEDGRLAVSMKGRTPGIVTLRLDPHAPDRVNVVKAVPAPF
ncbi:hypothetical protein [Sphingomonas panni]|uniref:hypothetical protein n=1 Tax=Sphingomonas panni TaxID=237612 RepID=UPI0030181A52